MESSEVFKIFKETKALLSGHFELRSGLHSDQYFQCALVLQHPRIAERLCAEVVEKMRMALGAKLQAQGVISPALGGLPMGHGVGRALNVRAFFAEKVEGRLALRRSFEIKPGEHLVVAEDVITRGGRVQEVMDIVTARGGIVEAVCVLVDRSGGKSGLQVPVFSLVQMEPTTWTPEECPLCRQGSKAVHPGS